MTMGPNFSVCASPGGTPPFCIELHYSSSVDASLQAVFEAAAARWVKIVIGGVPPFLMREDTINGLRIIAEVSPLPGPIGSAATTKVDTEYLREPGETPARWDYLPALATITLDAVLLPELSDEQRLELVSHEMGHALGFIVEIWEQKGLVQRNESTDTPVFTGPHARTSYGTLRGLPPTDVPLENYGLDHRFISHWKQSIFHTDLMTAVLEDGVNLVCPVTVAALQDMGYEVGAPERTDIDLNDPVLAISPPGTAFLALPVFLLNDQPGLTRPIPRPIIP